MTIDNETVLDIARLAQLQVNDTQCQQYANELANILNLVEQMNAVDTSAVEPMTHPFDASLRMREDRVTAADQRAQLQAASPAVEDGLFLVPKVID